MQFNGKIHFKIRCGKSMLVLVKLSCYFVHLKPVITKPGSGGEVHDAADGDEWVEAEDNGDEGGRVVEAALNRVHAAKYIHQTRLLRYFCYF